MGAGVVRSMTGYARARRSLGDRELAVSVKGVNHRGLDVHVRGPESISPLEGAVRSLVKAQVARGHVEIRIDLGGAGPEGELPSLNQAMLDYYVKVFRDAAAAHGLSETPHLNTALRMPAMWTSQQVNLPEGAEAALLGALGEALDEFNVFREREGAELAADIRKHNAGVQAAADEMERARQGITEVLQARLAERLSDLLKGAAVDPQRLAQEAAILADRSDIGEELARLKIHAGQLAALLDAGGETGKKMDFLLQEMNRETNTILSKTGGAADAGLRITELALAAKAAIEKVREQALNLE